MARDPEALAAQRPEALAAADGVVARVAGRQHAIVTIEQLLEAGLTHRMVRWRVERGWLHPVHRGIYGVGCPPTTSASRWIAAVLACGDGAVLSHCSAGALWEVRQSLASLVDVTSPGRRGRRRAGIRVHSAELLTAADCTEVDGIPVTTVARTIVDLGSVVSAGSHEYALHRAESRRILDLDELRAVLDRLPAHHRGAARTRALIGHPLHELDSRTRGPAERRFLRICRRHGVPMPEVNRWIPLPIASGGLEVDFCWADRGLVVEVDERRTHDTHRARRNDPARDRALVAAGWRPIRFPEAELDRRPAAVAADVLAALRSRT